MFFSDDKWFSNSQILKQYGLTPKIGIGTADIINHAAMSGSMTPENFAHYRDAYKTRVGPWKPNDALGKGGYSAKLDRFLTPGQLDDVLKNGASYHSAVLPKFSTGLKALGFAGLALDISTSSAEAASAAKAGRVEHAANIMARLVARVYVGLEGAAAGATLGGALGAAGGPLSLAGAIAGGISGGILGAVGGDIAVDTIWNAAGKAIDYLAQASGFGSNAASSSDADGSVVKNLVARGIPESRARQMLGILNTQFDARKAQDPAYTRDKFIDDVMKDVKENQSALPGEDSIIFTQFTDKNVISTTVLTDHGKTVSVTDLTSRTRSERSYDAKGRMTAATTHLNDGGRWENFYEVDSVLGTSKPRSERTYDAKGRMTAATTHLDNGERWENFYEVDSVLGTSKPRSERTYDAKGRMTAATTHLDNGERWENIYEVDSVLGTSKPRSERSYDAKGRMTAATTHLDNGSRWENFYEVDSVLGTSKPRSERTYDAKGRMTAATTHLDNGERWENFYEVDSVLGTSKPRSERTYDAKGRMTAATTHLDNGERWENIYEVDSVLGTSKPRSERSYDAKGRMTAATTHLDNGSRWENFYEVDSVLGTSKPRSERTYDAKGRMTAATTHLDNGERWENFYEVDSVLGTSKPRSERSYDAKGRMTAATTHLDNGERLEKIYEVDSALGTSKPRSEARYDAQGRMIIATTNLDDGGHSDRTYELDGALGTSKPRWEATYDAQGRITSDRTNWDNGSYTSSTEQATINEAAKLPTPDNRHHFITRDSGSFTQQRTFTRGSFSGVNLPYSAPIPTPNPRGNGSVGSGRSGSGESVSLPYSAPIPTPNPRGSGYGGSGRWGNYEDDCDNSDTYTPVEEGVTVLDTICVYADDPGPPPAPSSKSSSSKGSSSPKSLPVALDLDGDNVIDIRPLGAVDAQKDQGPRFDWNGDSVPEQTAWIGAGDGLLAIDLAADGSAGADGTINQAKEIAFTLWKTEDEIAAEGTAPDGDGQGTAISDLEGLRRYFDTNHNNMLDAGDARWSEFRVWQDADQNGVSDPGELRSMKDAGIKLLSLLPSPKDAKAFSDGSSISGTSHADMRDGSRMLVGDVGLAYRPNNLASNVA